MDYFGARYYSSAQGRFTSPDPLERLMLDQKKQALFITNPQRWNKYAYVLNNPLRNVDPNGLAEIPVWEKLSQELQEDLAKRLGGAKNAAKVWNGWSDDQRQRVINLRATLTVAGVWENVTSVSFGKINVEQHTFSHNKAFFTVDNSPSGYELAITTNKDIKPALEKAGFEDRFNPQHHENQFNYYQKGEGIVAHLGFLLPPSDAFIAGHYDRGGGSIFNKEHYEDWRRGTGPSPDDVTTALGRTAAAQYLKGISESMDKLLAQKKQ